MVQGITQLHHPPVDTVLAADSKLQSRRIIVIGANLRKRRTDAGNIEGVKSTLICHEIIRRAGTV